MMKLSIKRRRRVTDERSEDHGTLMMAQRRDRRLERIRMVPSRPSGPAFSYRQLIVASGVPEPEGCRTLPSDPPSVRPSVCPSPLSLLPFLHHLRLFLYLSTLSLLYTPPFSFLLSPLPPHIPILTESLIKGLTLLVETLKDKCHKRTKLLF